MECAKLVINSGPKSGIGLLDFGQAEQLTGSDKNAVNSGNYVLPAAPYGISRGNSRDCLGIMLDLK